MYVYDSASLRFLFEFRAFLSKVFPENGWNEVDQQYVLLVPQIQIIYIIISGDASYLLLML